MQATESGIAYRQQGTQLDLRRRFPYHGLPPRRDAQGTGAGPSGPQRALRHKILPATGDRTRLNCGPRTGGAVPACGSPAGRPQGSMSRTTAGRYFWRNNSFSSNTAWWMVVRPFEVKITWILPSAAWIEYG